MTRILAALFGLAALSVAVPAQAGDASCMWGRLSAAERDAVVAGYERAGPSSLDDILSQDRANTVASECLAQGLSEPAAAATRRVMALAFYGYVVEHASQVVLGQGLGVTPMGLDAGWASLDGDQRRAINSIASGDPTDTETFSAVLDAARIAGWRGKDMSDPALNRFIEHFLGRAVREQAEMQF